MKTKSSNEEKKWAYLFIAPMLIGTLIFGIFPIFYSVKISFTNWDGIGSSVFVGVDNFIKLFHDETMLYEIKNTLVYTVAFVPFTMLFSVIIAVLLNKGIKAKGVFRVIYFLPNIVMPVAAAMIWRFMLNSKFGIVNMALKFMHLPAPAWISDPKYIMSSIVIISVWSSVGYNVVILLAGLQGVSQDIYEAARLDGAGPVVTFWKITIPLISPTLFFLLTMGIINGMKAFDVIFTFVQNDTAGGPLTDATRTLVYGVYEKAFRYMKLGEASAEAMILFGMIIVVTAIQFKMQKKWVHYE